MKKIAYYPGCTIKETDLQVERSTRSLLRVLGYELEEIENWTCCGTVYGMASDDLYHQLAPIRNMIRCKSKEMLTLCDMCYNTFRRAEIFMEDKDNREKIDLFMDDEEDYKGVEVYHILNFLRDVVGYKMIEKSVKKKLSLRAMPYYGCMLLRPEEVAIDKPENPKVMQEILSLLGAEIVDSGLVDECCGSYHVLEDPSIVRRKSGEITKNAKENSADCLVLTCPLCRYNLTRFGDFPVYYLEDLIAHSFGLLEMELEIGGEP
jgi:heterodisulfide reductase subunit B